MSSADITLIADGETLTPKLRVISIDCHLQAHSIPEATIVINEPGLASREFLSADNAKLSPGKPLILKLGRLAEKAKEEAVFSGIISGQRLRVSDNGAQLILHCHSALISLVEPRLTQVFKPKSKDDAVIKELAKPSGVTVDVAASKMEHEQLAMLDQHAWGYIRQRAELAGLIVMPTVDKNGKETLKIQPPDKFSGGPFKIDFGITDLIAIDLATDATNALNKLKTASWDATKQANTKGQASPKPATSMKITPKKGLDAAAASKGMLREAEWLPILGCAQTPAQLQGWAAGETVYRELDRYKGSLTLPGTNEIKPGGRIELANFPKAMNGEYLVTGVRHKLGPGDWTTTVFIGLPITRTSVFNGIHRQQPAIRNLLVGKALGYGKKDEGKLTRIQVEVPALGKDAKLWARPASPYASKDACFFFPPAKGDEVILGWLDGSASDPVILGSLYNQNAKPADEYHDQNMKRSLKLSAKDTLEFDAKEKKLSLIHQKNSLISTKDSLLVDVAKELVLKSADATSITPGKDLKIEAGGGGVEIKAPMVEIK